MLPTYIVTLLLWCTTYAGYSFVAKLYVLGVVVLNTILVPSLMLAWLRRTGRLSSYRIDERRERIMPLLVGAVCYVICAITLSRIVMGAFLARFMIAAAACEIMALVVTLRWKISLHLTGMGAAVAILLIVNIVGQPLFAAFVAAVMLSGILASARLYLGCHNPWQIAAGFCGGFVVSTIALFI